MFSRHLAHFFSGLLFYPAQGIIGPYSFLLFIVPLTLAFTILFFYLPETKGRATTDQESWRAPF